MSLISETHNKLVLLRIKTLTGHEFPGGTARRIAYGYKLRDLNCIHCETNILEIEPITRSNKCPKAPEPAPDWQI